MKRMKRIFSIFLTLCLLLTLLSSAFTVFAEDYDGISEDVNEDYIDEYYEVPEEAEELYIESDTIYNLEDEDEDEDDTPPEPEDVPPPEEPEVGDDDQAVYDNNDFYAESAAQLDGADYVFDEILVKFKEPWQVPGKEKQLQHEIDKLEKIGFVEGLDVYVIKVSELTRNPEAILNKYKNNKYIEWVEPNYLARESVTPNDPNYGSMALVFTVLNAQKGWDIISGSSGPVIAVVDSGVANHPDLPPLLPGYASVAGLSPNNDKSGHGTGVAGTIGAVGDNKLGGVGINWSASIMPVKVDDANNSYSAANFAKGIMWAADNGAMIISTSIGFSSDSATIKSAIDYAFSKGCAIFAAAGNDGKVGICYPARYANVLAVGSSTNGSAIASYSNYGPDMGVLAYSSYNTTTPSGGYSTLSGTSFATPQVAGLASLVWALNPKLTNEQVYNVIRQGAKGNGSYISDEVGYGFINIANTLLLAQATLGGSSDADAKAKAEAEAAAAAEAAEKAKAEADAAAAAAAAAEAEAKAKAEAEAAAAEAAAQAAAEAEAKAKAEAEAAAAAAAAEKAAAEAAAAAAAEAEAKAKAEAEAAAAAAAEAEAKAKAEAEAKAKADAEAAAAAEAEAKAKAEAEAAAQAKAEAEAKAIAEAAAKAAEEAAQIPPETPQETRTPPVIELIGFSEITLEYGQPYIETSYTAFDCKGIDLKSSVTVTGSVDIWKAGLYTITYEVTDSAGLSARATRTVLVNPKPPEPEPPQKPKLTLIGSNPIILHSTSATVYKEQMARAVDGDGTDISNLVTCNALTATQRTTPGTYVITYNVTSPVSGLSETITRNVRVVGPKEKKDPRVSYGLSGQAKAGAKVTHTGIVSKALGFIDLKVSSIDKNMTITVKLLDSTTKKAVLTDTFSAAGTKQYKIDEGKYELEVSIDKANGNSKYGIDLLMPETAATLYFDDEEVPLATAPYMPQIAPIGSNPIILHLGGTKYLEQGAVAVDYLGNNISDQIAIDNSGFDEYKAGTYIITYSVPTPFGDTIEVTREVRIIEPNEFGEFDEIEVPYIDLPEDVPGPQEPPATLPAPTTTTYTVVKGDSLYSIAQKLYGNGNCWGEIYDMNKDIIGKDPRMINIGIVLTVKEK